MYLITLVKLFHILGLVLGFGGALFLDFTILTRGIFRPVCDYTIQQVDLLSRAVTIGLVLLWLTGVSLLSIRISQDPQYAGNPKLWAKIAIVFALTVNGLFIHRFVLPLLRQRAGRKLFQGLGLMQTGFLTLAGSISLVSWTTPILLGLANELNHVTPMSRIVSVYAGAVLATWLVIFGTMRGMSVVQSDRR